MHHQIHHHPLFRRRRRRPFAAAVAVAAATAVTSVAPVGPVDRVAAEPVVAPTSHVITGPAGSGSFGQQVVALPNGNLVVVDPSYDLPGAADVGAVHLYDGTSLELISTLTGSTPGDAIGSGDLVVVSSALLVGSPHWHQGTLVDAGAITRIDATVGVSGQVSLSNSLVGSSAGDAVGGNIVKMPSSYGAITVVPSYDAGGQSDVGAALPLGADTPTSGLLSAANAWTGSTTGDGIAMTATPVGDEGFAVVALSRWDGPVGDAGLVATVRRGTTPFGPLGANDGLRGAVAGDRVGEIIVPLRDGSYAVGTPAADAPGRPNVGAVTVRSTSSPAMVLSVQNSVSGGSADDGLNLRIVALADGDLATVWPYWDSATTLDVGAVRWIDGVAGASGILSPATMFVGESRGDGDALSVTPLLNGAYVVCQPFWDDGASNDLGAVTWRPANDQAPSHAQRGVSTIGATIGDQIGSGGITVLADGDYVISSPAWDHGVLTEAGAVTWRPGDRLASGEVGRANSTVGTQSGEAVGVVTALTDGAFTVGAPSYDRNGLNHVGLVGWRPGTAASAGELYESAALVGSFTADLVGMRVIALPGGAWLSVDPYWNGGSIVDAGAATYRPAGSPSAGVIGSDISLVGAQQAAQLGAKFVSLGAGRVLVSSPAARANGIQYAGLLGVAGPGATTGLLTEATGIAGVASGEGGRLTFGPQSVWSDGEVAVGSPSTNRVILIGDRPIRQQQSPSPDPTPTPDPVPEAGALHPMTPARVADSRPGFATADGVLAGFGAPAAGAVVEVPMAGRVGIAADASSVVLNVSVVDARGPGFVTVFPCGSERPNAASLTYAAGQTISNMVTSQLGTGGKVCVHTHAAADLVVDVTGWYPAAPSLRAMSPARVADSRPGFATADGVLAGFGALASGAVVEVPVANRVGVGPLPASVVLNVSVVDARGPGFVTVFPCGSERPNAASLTYAAGQTISNAAVARVGDHGSVCVYAFAATDLVIDVAGWFPDDTSTSTVQPARLADSRPGFGTVDGAMAGFGSLAAGSVLEVPVSPRAGVGAGARAVAVVLNVSVVDARGPGFVTVFPCGSERPNAASSTYAAGQTISNAVVAQVGRDGRVCVYTHAATDLVVDVSGWVAEELVT